MKKRGLSSPDKADALALTFADIILEPSKAMIRNDRVSSRAAKDSRRNVMPFRVRR